MTGKATWRSEALGEAGDLQVGGGTLRYFERGSGPAVVFVHGLLVNANLWRKVVPKVAEHARCITLDLPLGSHLTPFPEGTDLSTPALADLIADALEALDLDDVTLVGNDTGGAVSQVVATRRPERVGSLVLTSCDAFDNFPPKAFRPLIAAAKMPGALYGALSPLRARPARRLPIAFGWLAKRPMDDQASDSYCLPALEDKGVMHDVREVLKGVDPRHTEEAARRLATFDKPALLAWSREDKFFPPEQAERLAKVLPQGRLEWIDDSYTFSPEDRPDRVAALVGEHVAGHASVA